MKYSFPEGLYTDVRIEHIFTTNVFYTFRELDECKEKSYSAAFIRVFDGETWYYASTTNIDAIQAEIDSLASLAKKNDKISESKVYKNFSTNVDEVMVFTGKEVSAVSLNDKIELLQPAMSILEKNEYTKLWRVLYIDEYKVKEFYNSKGASVKFDYQRCGVAAMVKMSSEDKKFESSFSKTFTEFSAINGYEAELAEKLKEFESFLLNSEAVKPGVYPVVFAPEVTGVFAHECFGHKSESDFMVGDEETKKEWALGKRVGCDELTIVDSGKTLGNGYVPYDDEGIKAGTTYLVKNGILTGRLHNAVSAADLDEEVTGNGRAVSFEFEPIVRMTNTYFEAGAKTFEEIVSQTENGIFVKSYSHGSGMSTFTIAPRLAYYIKNGKIDKPVRVSVVTGSVFEALENIDMISDKVEDEVSITGGCGKNEQFPLAVGMGGPYIRVKNMNVQ